MKCSKLAQFGIVIAVAAMVALLLPAPVYATALSANRDTPRILRPQSQISLTVKASEVIYAGALVSVDSSGEAVNATDSASDQVVGRAAEKVDNTVDGHTIKVDIGIFGWAKSGTINDANIGDIVYVVDNQTVAIANPGNACIAGVVVAQDSSYAYVETGYLPRTAGAFTTLSASGAASLASTLAVTGAQTNSGALGVAGAVNALSTLDVAGAATLAGTLDVTGAARIGVLKTYSHTVGNLTLTSAYYGKTVLCATNGAHTITLPANGAAAGSYIDFLITGTDDDAPTVAAATADTLRGPNDVDLDSVTFGTGHRIGAYFRVISDGSYWTAVNLGTTTMTGTD